MENQQEIICPSCKFSIPASAVFCPNCGKQLKENPAGKTLAKKIVVYLVSLFLPPFGLWYVFKYLKQGDYESRKIAIAALILTAISTLFEIWLTGALINSIFKSFDGISNLGV